MIPTPASMDLCEQLAALSLGNAPHEDTIGATVVEIPFHHRVAFSQSYYALCGHIVIRKGIVFQVVPDLGDPCIGTSLSNWGGPMGSLGSSVAHTTPGALHGWIATRIASFEVLDRSPSPSSAG